MLPKGTYPAVATVAQSDAGEVACQFGESKEKGTPFAAVLAKVIRGPFAKHTITWQGYFSGGATEHTIKALRNFGFTGDQLDKFPAQRPENEVEIVVEHETNDKGQTFAKVAWVNSPNRGMKISAPIAGGELRKFAAKFQATLKAAPAIVGTKAVVEEPSAAPASGDTWNGNDAPDPPTDRDFDQSPPPGSNDDIPF